MRLLMLLFVLIIVTRSVAEENQFIYDDHGKRDPFWPLISANGTFINYESDLLITDLRLEGIISEEEGGKNLAIINGNIVQTNDTIGPFQVRDVSTDSVSLIKGKEIYTLKLKKE